MSTQENRVLVNRYYTEVLNGRNVAVLDDLLDPQFKSRFGPNEVDAAGYRQAVLRSLAMFDDLKVEILAQIAEGDLVATRWRATGTVPGGQGNMPRQVVLSAMHFHRITHGRLAEHWEELDSASLRAQLG